MKNIDRMDVAKIVIDTWSEVFAKNDLSEDDDFFALGGDSMLLTIIALQLEEKLGIMIDHDLIYEASTIGGFSDAIVDACN